MPSGLSPLRDDRRAAVAAAIGVTRVARLTGLDRTGVEVAVAVRPTGHVLQVSNGKGETFAEAAAGAVLEATELWAAERPLALVHGTAAELRARFGDAVLAPADLAPAAPGWDGVRLAWRAAEDLVGGGTLLVPAHAVHCPPAGSEPLGPALVRWTSNGMGAHPDRAAARVHALLEAIERDRLARALPHGFTDREVRRRIVAPPSLARAAPRTAALVRRIEAGGFRVHLFDLSAAGGLDGDLDLGLPCAAAALVDLGSGPVPVTAGYACRLRRDDALRAAVLEAAQSRLTEIHGAREDVVHGGREEGIGLARLCARARPTRPAAALPDLPSSAPPRTALANLARRLGRAGFSRAAACDLAAPPGIHAVKMVVPGLLLSELL